MAQRINFHADDLLLEGLYVQGSLDRATVITHPHPLYGGDMRNPVVEAIDRAYRNTGFSTLRFNFRGAGNSDGSYDQGLGERTDVIAAIDHLRARGYGEIHLSGYSFGAWVNAMALQRRLPVDELIMVAPPVAFIQFDDAIRLPSLSVVIAGSRDEFAPPSLIRRVMHRWNPTAELVVIEGADHFFFGHLDQVSRLLAERLRPAG